VERTDDGRVDALVETARAGAALVVVLRTARQVGVARVRPQRAAHAWGLVRPRARIGLAKCGDFRRDAFGKETGYAKSSGNIIRFRLYGLIWVLQPPSTVIVVPVMYDASSLASHATTRAISSGRP
jgi:hypothetical protein